MYYLITHRESVKHGYGYAFPTSGINAGNLTMTPRFEDRDLHEVVTRVQLDCIKQLGIIPLFLKWELPEGSDIVVFRWMVDGDGPAIAFPHFTLGVGGRVNALLIAPQKLPHASEAYLFSDWPIMSKRIFPTVASDLSEYSLQEAQSALGFPIERVFVSISDFSFETKRMVEQHGIAFEIDPSFLNGEWRAISNHGRTNEQCFANPPY